MFGYIKPFTPELKIKEHEAFRAVYCGLCHQLGQSFSVLSRLTLNYDFVFLAMLYYSETSLKPEIVQGRCCVNPLVKVPLCKSDKGMVYTADVAALMIYYKIIDNIWDSGKAEGLMWKAMERFWRSAKEKAAKRQPNADHIVANMIKEQQAIEEQQSASVDMACEPTAKALAQLAGDLLDAENEKRDIIEKMGYQLGRYIYMCDAMEDLEKDIKSDNYNPLIYRYLSEDSSDESIAFARSQMQSSIYMTIGELGRLAQNVEFDFFAPILHNIINFGMKNSVAEILKKKGGISDEEPL